MSCVSGQAERALVSEVDQGGLRPGVAAMTWRREHEARTRIVGEPQERTGGRLSQGEIQRHLPLCRHYCWSADDAKARGGRKARTSSMGRILRRCRGGGPWIMHRRAGRTAGRAVSG